MVAQVETEINKVETPHKETLPALPPETQSLIQGLEAHRQEVDKLIADLKDQNGSQQSEDLKKKLNDIGAKLLRSAYRVQHLVNSLSPR